MLDHAFIAQHTQGFAAFAEDRLGTLMPGMRADFLLLDSDPMLASASDLYRMTPAETWIGGARYYSRDAKSGDGDK